MTYREILRWFADDSSPYSHYSIHNLARIGALKFAKQIGDWFEPTTVSEALRLLVQQHSPDGVKVYVAKDGIIYREDIQQLGTVQPADGPAHDSPRDGPGDEEEAPERISSNFQHLDPAGCDVSETLESTSSAGLESESDSAYSSPESTLGEPLFLSSHSITTNLTCLDRYPRGNVESNNHLSAGEAWDPMPQSDLHTYP